ncbi:AAC(3) family N-acetyltransferase [Candidatus Margulisiibacteriota bacterium]
MTKFTKNSLINDLIKLNIQKDDTVLVRGDMGKIGRVDGKLSEVFLSAFLDLIGPNGTLVALSFTKSFLRPFVNKDHIFSKDTPSTAGAIAKIFLNHPNAVRSQHPTNSVVAIGKNAIEITKNHDEKALSYSPIKKIIELNGKMILIGCIDSSPGFTTVHYAQEKLGLTQKNILRNRLGVYYEKDGQRKFFRRKDIGGCSGGFHKFYPLYKGKNKLTEGKFGNASCFTINTKDAFEIEYNVLKNDPRFALCDKPMCKICRGTWFFNKKDMPKFYIKYFFQLMKKIFFAFRKEKL